MNEFIEKITKQLGISDHVARTATGGILANVQKQVPASDFSALLGKLPGAESLLQKAADSGTKSSEGGLGSLMGMASAALGGKSGSLLTLAGALKDSGLGMDQVGSFASMFMSYVKDKAGADLVQRIAGHIPELGKLTD